MIECWCSNGHRWTTDMPHPGQCPVKECDAKKRSIDLVICLMNDGDEEGKDWFYAIESTYKEGVECDEVSFTKEGVIKKKRSLSIENSK